jgi:hypothetical protein
MSKTPITEEDIEAAFDKWFDAGEALSDKSAFRAGFLSCWSSVRRSSGPLVQAALQSAADTPALYQLELEDGTIEHIAGCFGNIIESNGVRVVKKTPLYLHPPASQPNVEPGSFGIEDSRIAYQRDHLPPSKVREE